MVRHRPVTRHQAEQAIAFVNSSSPRWKRSISEGSLGRIGASIGIAFVREQVPGDELLKNADIALYQAKSIGGGTFASILPRSAINAKPGQ